MNLTPQPDEARELAGRELTRALRDHWGDDFADTQPAWDIEPTERDSIFQILGESK